MAGWHGSIESGAFRLVGRAAAIVLVVLLITSMAPIRHPAGAASLTNGGFTTSATVGAANYAPGSPVPIVARVTSSTTVTVLVDVEVHGPTSNFLERFVFDDQPFTTGVERTFPVTWTAPANAAVGGYTIQIAIFTPHFGQVRHGNLGAGFFTIGMGSGPPAGGPPRIMPLGDSLTDGFNVEGGYRIDLSTRLAAGSHTFDFVGSRYNGPVGLADKNHEGHTGWRIDELTSGAEGWLRAYQPQVVLLLIGTNDMTQNYDPVGAPARLGALLDLIKATVPGVRIVVSSLPRVIDADALDRIQTFNAAIPGVVASKGNAVAFVDAFAAIQLADLHTDGLHLNTNGYSRLAQVWYPAIHTFLNNLPTPTPTPTATPTLVPTATATPAPCVPRPPVGLRTQALGGGRLGVTITATGAGNLLHSIRVGAARNATIDVGGRTGVADFTVTLAGTSATTFATITRTSAGATVHVPLAITDQCGEWRTFVGGGPTAF